MENNFNNEEMMNNGFEAMGSGRKLIHDACNVYQIASAIIVAGAIGYKIAKYIVKKRKQAKKQVEVVNNVETENIETTEEN